MRRLVVLQALCGYAHLRFPTFQNLYQTQPNPSGYGVHNFAVYVVCPFFRKSLLRLATPPPKIQQKGDNASRRVSCLQARAIIPLGKPVHPKVLAGKPGQHLETLHDRRLALAPPQSQAGITLLAERARVVNLVHGKPSGARPTAVDRAVPGSREERRQVVEPERDVLVFVPSVEVV